MKSIKYKSTRRALLAFGTILKRMDLKLPLTRCCCSDLSHKRRGEDFNIFTNFYKIESTVPESFHSKGCTLSLVIRLLFLIVFLWNPSQMYAADLPRMASLKASEVNVRVGPGSQYPIVWILVCTGLPVRIVAEFDMWRKIEDPLGTTGWIHKRLLSGRQTLFTKMEHTLYAAPDVRARPVARLGKGAILEKDTLVQSGQQIWYAVKVQGLRGFIPQTACWGDR